MDRAADSSANVYVDKFWTTSTPASITLKGLMTDQDVTDDEDERREAKSSDEKAKRQRSVPKLEVNRFKTVTPNKPKRKTTSSRVLA
jgi:hypothetical protein